MAYADWDAYKAKYLMGKDPVIPENEFPFWSNKASARLDAFTLDRLKDGVPEAHEAIVIRCACELAEYYFLTEDNVGKSSQSAEGRSITYKRGGDLVIAREYLGTTGLLFRGAC